jgi:3-oxoacyl-[acyl-carrier protein] reductase
MDLGIMATSAVACRGSKMHGKGYAMALAGEGVKLIIIGRGKEALKATAEEIRSTSRATVNMPLTTIATDTATDIATEAGCNLALAASPKRDFIVNIA